MNPVDILLRILADEGFEVDEECFADARKAITRPLLVPLKVKAGWLRILDADSNVRRRKRRDELRRRRNAKTCSVFIARETTFDAKPGDSYVTREQIYRYASGELLPPGEPSKDDLRKAERMIDARYRFGGCAKR